MESHLTVSIMSEVVLPGELVDAKHPNLKLGPGLLQLSDGSIISTKAGMAVGRIKTKASEDQKSNLSFMRLSYSSTLLLLRNTSLVPSLAKVVQRASELISAVHTTQTPTSLKPPPSPEEHLRCSDGYSVETPNTAPTSSKDSL